MGIAFYDNTSKQPRVFLKELDDHQLAYFQEDDRDIQGVAQGILHGQRLVPINPELLLGVRGKWVNMKEVAKKPPSLSFAPGVADRLLQEERLQFTDVTFESAGIQGSTVEVDVNEKLIRIRGEVYSFHYKAAGKEIPLSHMSPKEKRDFLIACARAAEKTLENVPFDQAVKININVMGGKFSAVEVFDSQDNKVAEKKATLAEFDPVRDSITEFALSANTGLLAIHRRDIDVRGIPNGGEYGAQLHLIAHALDHTIEYGVNQNPTDRSLRNARTLKRILLRQIPGCVTEELLKEIQRDYEMRGDLQRLLNSVRVRADTLQGVRDRFPIDATSVPDSMYVQFTQATEVRAHFQVAKDDARYELVAAKVKEADDKWIAYSFRNDTWYRCEDELVTRVENAEDLMRKLSATPCELVYRRIPETEDTRAESSLRLLHSNSPLDNDRWLDGKLVLDYAGKLARRTGVNATVLSAGGRAFALDQDHPDDMAALKRVILAHPGERLFIPIIKKGRHWVMLHIENGVLEYFDSVGRKVPAEIDQLARDCGLQQLEKVLDKDQGRKWQADGFRCGYFSLYYLLARTQGDLGSVRALALSPRDSSAINQFRADLQCVYSRYSSHQKYGFD